MLIIGVYRRFFSRSSRVTTHHSNMHSWQMGLIQKMRRPLRQCHTAEAIRLLLATGLGFCLHLLLEGCRSQNIGDSHCRPCDCGRPLDVAGAPNSQPRERYRPHSIQSVIRFQYFNMTHIHDNFDEDPRTHLLDHQKADIQDILNNAIVLFNTGKPRKFKLNGLVNGYRRVDPLRGEEFILDVQLSPELDLTSHRSDDDNGINRVYHRLELVKPFGISQLVETLHINEETMIHFILPVSLRHLDQLVSFLEVFEDMCLKQKQHVYLMVVLHTGSSDYDQNLETQINLKLRNLHQRYPGSHIRSIRTSRAFSRSSGLELGARQLPGDVLVFFADVDVMFTAEFLTRCRQNAVYGQQVYYPILFGQYNPEVVEMYSPKHELPAHRDEIHRHTGNQWW